jgi:hypothetical protein
MSLLTEKQISEIIDMATQQDEFAKILKLKLNHWNSNQKSSTQFEPLSDKIIEDMRVRSPWHLRTFRAGVKFAEDMHGITGELK